MQCRKRDPADTRISSLPHAPVTDFFLLFDFNKVQIGKYRKYNCRIMMLDPAMNADVMCLTLQYATFRKDKTIFVLYCYTKCPDDVLSLMRLSTLNKLNV